MKSLIKALNILELFWDHQEEMSLADIAEASGLNKTTVYRIVSTLLKRGYLKQRGERGKYSLGTVFLEFSGIVKRRTIIRDVSFPYLIELSRLVKESVLLAVWNGREGVFTETFHETSHANGPLKVIPDEGITIPLHCTSAGKIILADMSEKDLDSYIESKQLKSYTPNTMVDINCLKDHLMIVRREGIAYDDEEYFLGVRGVASGLRNDEGEIAGAISVIGPSVRLTHAISRAMAMIVRSYALRISRELGYQGKSLLNVTCPPEVKE